ncbi:MAG: multicopper oxidase domain-containing protein, partial [Nocardiopsaceae bacterium]|nr:multicopper oxidase domain-containing protein [Nocardiopsaceae bacterium]
MSRRKLLVTGGGLAAGLIALDRLDRITPNPVQIRPASATTPQTHLPGSQIPQFTVPLPTFVGQRVDSPSYQVHTQEFQQQVLPASVYASAAPPFNRGTFVWGQKNGTQPPHWPGHTTIAHRHTPTTVTYINNLPKPGQSHLEPLLTIDQTLAWANPLNNPADDRDPYQGVIPIVYHLHGAEVGSEFDGTMMEWFTNNGIHGPGYNTLRSTGANAAVYQYPNSQPPLTMFFHDHTRGITRTNVYAGMVGQYWIRDEFDTGEINNPLRLPAGNQEIELTIQDRMFDTNGQLFYPADEPANSPLHPFWPEDFFGDVVCVNGAAWPFLEVEPRRYRFRMLNFSNMRFIRTWLEDAASGAAGPPIWQIGTDGGLLDVPVRLSADPNDDSIFGGTKVLLGTTERNDVIIDFTGLAGHAFTLRNNAPAPFPDGEAANFDPATSGRIMQFRVNQPLSGQDNTFDPASGDPLRGGQNQLPAIVRLADPATGQPGRGVQPTVGVTRQLVFVEAENDNGSIEYLVNNMIQDGVRQGTNILVPGSEPTRQGGSAATDKTGMRMTEVPRVGDTEVWEILNLTDIAHSVHIHLIQFQVLNRQEVDLQAYQDLYNSQFPGGTFFGTHPDGTAGTVDYPSGVYIPGYGPPNDYLTPNDDGAVGGNPAFSPFLGTLHSPETYEAGWKDVFHVLPNAVNRLVVRFSPQDINVGDVGAGQNRFTID